MAATGISLRRCLPTNCSPTNVVVLDTMAVLSRGLSCGAQLARAVATRSTGTPELIRDREEADEWKSPGSAGITLFRSRRGGAVSCGRAAAYAYPTVGLTAIP